jgi:hypothetical protein
VGDRARAIAITVVGERIANEQARRIEADAEARSLERLAQHPAWASKPVRERTALMAAFGSGHACGVLLGIELGFEQAAFALDALGDHAAAERLRALDALSKTEVRDGK